MAGIRCLVALPVPLTVGTVRLVELPYMARDCSTFKAAIAVAVFVKAIPIF